MPNILRSKGNASLVNVYNVYNVFNVYIVSLCFNKNIRRVSLFLLICFGDRSSHQRCSVKEFFLKMSRLLLWRKQFPQFYNYSFERAKILFCYYLYWILQLATLLKMDSIIDVFVSRKLAANEQMNRTSTVLSNPIIKVASCYFIKNKLHCRYLMSKFSEILILAWRKIFSFYPILH